MTVEKIIEIVEKEIAVNIRDPTFDVWLKTSGITSVKKYIEENYIDNKKLQDIIFLCTRGDTGDIDKVRFLKELRFKSQ